MTSLRYAFARMLKKMKLSAIRDSAIDATSVVEAGSQVVHCNIGRHSFCGYDCTLVRCDIGAFCSISDQVYIGGAAHPMHFVSTSPVFLSHRDSVKAKYAHHEFLPTTRTTIGSDVWIGHGAKLKAGVLVGNGAVIGMGAIVTRNVRDYAIVAGNPAREIGRRFDDAVVEVLLKSEWWNFDDARLSKLASSFNDPSAFIELVCSA